MKHGMKMVVLAVVAVACFAASLAIAADPGAFSTPGKAVSKGEWKAGHAGKVFKKSPNAAQQVVKYVCPMDGYTSDKPGKCPKCGMELKKVVKAKTFPADAKAKK